MNKKLEARILESKKNLWTIDTDNNRTFDGINDGRYWVRRELAILSQEQIEAATRGVKKLIRPYYSKDYFQSREEKLCLYIAGKSIKPDMKKRIGEKYFNGKWSHYGYDFLKNYPAETEYLIFPHKVPHAAETIPLAFVPPNSVIGEGLYAIADPSPWEVVIISSALYMEWAKTVGSLDLSDGAAYFPFPAKQDGDCEAMEPYAAALRVIWESGQMDELPVVIKQLNDYVDSLYRERCSAELDKEIDPTDRLRYLFALCDKRGAVAKAAKELEHYNRHNILAHPEVPPLTLPTMLAILNSEEPVHPSGLDEYNLSRDCEPYGIFATLTRKGLVRRVDTPQTLIDKNGRKLNTLYEAVPDYVDFFVDWIELYLPADTMKRKEVWRLAQLPGSGERNPQFPTVNEYNTLKLLWNVGQPLSKKEIKEQGCVPGTGDSLMEKELVENAGSGSMRYQAAISELDFDGIAIREILSKIAADRAEKVIFETENRLDIGKER